MRNILNYLGYGVLIILLAAFDVSFFPALGNQFLLFNLTLTTSLFILLIFRVNLSLTIYTLSTVLIGFVSGTFLITQLLIGLIVLLVVDQLFETIFTNRSYYAVTILGVIGYLLYYILFLLFLSLGYLFTDQVILPTLSSSWFYGVFVGMILLIFLFSCAYLLINFLSRQLKSYFIVSHSR